MDTRELALVRALAWGSELDRLVGHYLEEQDVDRRGRLADVYQDLAGERIGNRISQRSD
jgi:hypothetical protein